jgi:hypothetical protein
MEGRRPRRGQSRLLHFNDNVHVIPDRPDEEDNNEPFRRRSCVTGIDIKYDHAFMSISMRYQSWAYQVGTRGEPSSDCPSEALRRLLGNKRHHDEMDDPIVIEAGDEFQYEGHHLTVNKVEADRITALRGPGHKALFFEDIAQVRQIILNDLI